MGAQTSDTSDRFSSIIGTIVVLGFLASISGCIVLNTLGVTGPRLEVVTSAQPAAEGGWLLSGRVLHEGAPVSGADVWAIAVDAVGNRYTPPATKTSATGEFSLEPIPATLSGDLKRGPQEVTISSRAMLTLDKEPESVKGKEKLPLGGGEQIRRVELPLTAIVVIPIIFAASVFLAIIHVPSRLLAQVKWYVTVVLTFVFTLTMLAYIALGLRYVHTTSSANEVLSLGFANFYYGSYVKDVPPEWLMSFTSPTQAQLGGGEGDMLV